MDAEKLAALIGKKHGSDIDPADPILLVGTMVEGLTKEALASLSKVVTDAAGQAATAAVLAENTARARSDRIVTDAAKYGSEQIRIAGEAASTRIVNEVKAALELVAAEKRESRSMMRTSMAAAAASLLAVMALISWQVWGPT